MNFRKTAIVFLLFVLFSVPVGAQEVLSLEDAVQRAEKENMDLKLAEISYQKAEIEMENLKLQNKFNYTEPQKIEINKNYLSSLKNLQDSRSNIIKSIIRQYTNLWLNQKEIEAQRLSTRAEERLYNEMLARFDLAQISKLDLVEQLNSFNSSSNQLENLKDNYEQNLLEFKTAINLEDAEIEIKEISEPALWQIEKDEAIEKGISESKEIKIAELELQLAENRMERSRVESASAAQKTAVLDLEAAEINLQKTKDEVETGILKAHLNLKQAEKNIALMKGNLERAETQYQQTKREFELGSVTRTALLQYESSLSNSEYQLKNAYLNYYLAKEELADLLNMEPGVTIYEQ